jgi:CHAD domain-containing protein
MPEPVTTLLRQSLILKGAIADCLDEPKPKAVHQLRSTTRRLEATVELLANSVDMPTLRHKSEPFRQTLAKIRRAAGHVRDLDVHLEMLRSYKQDRGAIQLTEDLASARKDAARKLQKRLMKNRHKVERALDSLEIALKPAVDLNLSGVKLANIARTWLASTVHNLDPHHDEELHSFRKACKTARYIAEIGSDDAKAAATLTNHLVSVQQSTGAWHDCLLLLNEAHDTLPENSPLIARIHANSSRLRRKAESAARRLLTRRILTKAA